MTQNSSPELQPQVSPVSNSLVWKLLIALTILIGIVLRLTLRHSALWEDEVIATTHAVQPFVRLLTNVVVNEIHPPLYFIQLHLWSFLSKTDDWFIANSVLWSLAALYSMYYVVRTTAGKPRALAATALFAVLPASVWMAEEVRMYAMLSVMLLWMLYFTYRSFAFSDRETKNYLAVFLLAVAIAYMHAIGFVAVLFYGLFAATLLFTRRAPRGAWLAWFSIFGAAGILTVPLLAGGLLHQADMPPITHLHDIVNYIGSTIGGEGSKSVAWLEITGALLYLLVTILGTAYAPTRRITLCFLVLPMLFCIAVGLAVKPIFKTNFFSTFSSPFIAIVLAELLVSLPLNVISRFLAVIAIIGLLLSVAVTNRLTLNHANNYYREASDVITAQKQPGDVVWVPQMSIFWGMAWYLDGSDWGSPMAIRGPVRPGSGWWKVFNQLGPERVKQLELIPTGQAVQAGDITLVTAITSEDQALKGERIWLVTYAPRNDIPATMPADSIGSLTRVKSYSFPPIQVTLYANPAQ